MGRGRQGDEGEQVGCSLSEWFWVKIAWPTTKARGLGFTGGSNVRRLCGALALGSGSAYLRAWALAQLLFQLGMVEGNLSGSELF